MKRFNVKPNGQKGYILLMAILISSIILAISFGIYALTIKEIILASFLKDSAKALGAADRRRGSSILRADDPCAR